MKKRILQRAFTLTEVIVIVAVIGILAALIIPSFMNTADRAKDKTDENTVATLNSVIDSGLAIKKDLSDVKKVRAYLRSSGYADDQLKPEKIGDDANDKYCFVWDKKQEVILMVRLIDTTVYYPENYRDDVNTGTWYFLDREPKETDCSDTLFPCAQAIARAHIAEQIEKMTDEQKKKTYVFVEHVKLEYEYDGVTYPITEDGEERIERVYAIYDGTKDGTSTNPLGEVNLIEKASGSLYNSTDSAKQVWTLEVTPKGMIKSESITGYYDSEVSEYDKDGNTLYMFTKVEDSISTEGTAIQLKEW